MRRERVRLRNLFDRFQIAARILHRETLRVPSGRTVSTDAVCAGRAGPVFDAEPETRRHAVLEDFEDDDPGTGP